VARVGVPKRVITPNQLATAFSRLAGEKRLAPETVYPAADTVARIENRDIVAETIQLVGGAQTCESSTNDGNLRRLASRFSLAENSGEKGRSW